MNAPASASTFAKVRHLIVLGHPDEESFCASVARAYCDAVQECGQEARLRDLYALRFNPVLGADQMPGRSKALLPAPDLAEDLELLRSSDVIVLVYPIWFGTPPAIIKGYVDRVFGAGFAPREIKQGAEHPVLRGKRLVSFTSSATTRPWLEEKGQWGALRHAFDSYLQTIFSLRDGGHTHFDAIVPGLKERFVRENLADVRQVARRHAAELFDERRAAKTHLARERAFSDAP